MARYIVPAAEELLDKQFLVLDHGLDDTTSMLFTFKGGSTGYLATIIATAECWRLQVFGANGWAEMGSVPHLTTWTLRRCYINQPMEFVEFPGLSTERAELDHFADSIVAGKQLVNDRADILNNSAVLDAIVASAERGGKVAVA